MEGALYLESKNKEVLKFDCYIRTLSNERPMPIPMPINRHSILICKPNPIGSF